MPIQLKTAADDRSVIAAASPPTYADFLAWIRDNREKFIDEWVDQLSFQSPSYEKRPIFELYGTVTEAFEANMEALASGKLERIERFIDYITEKRLRSGFPLSDVQKAFELFRKILVDRLTETGRYELLALAVGRVNDCLAYTIHRFSDHFQNMHELAIRRYAEDLERQVEIRTGELAESERRYKTLVNEINDGYFMIQDEKIIFVNRAFCRMHGTTPREAVGRPFLQFVTEDCRERVMANYRASLNSPPSSPLLEYTRTGAPPDKAATEIKSKVVDLGHGPVTIGICRDISRRVAMEAKIRKNERLAYIGHLAASLSHEIRNPLSTCTLNMQILEENLKLEGFDRRRLEITVQELTRLEDILRQLLDLARPIRLEFAMIDVSDLIRDCVDLLSSKTQAKDLTVFQRHQSNLPPVRADAGKIEQVLLNLLLNAIEAVDVDGRITIWNKTRETDRGRFVELGVHDNGPGIGPDQMDDLFTPFLTGKRRGTGLGLSIVKRITDAHSGTVTVKSNSGLGATFIVRLPCRP